MDPLLTECRSLFASRPGHVLVVGGFSGAFDDLEVTRCPDWHTEMAGGPFDTILARLPDASWRDRLEHWRSLLGERGRLVLVLSPGDLRETTLELSRLGFVILEERRPGNRDPRACLLSARRDGYSVRAYEPGDEDAILELFQPSFHAIRSPAHWRWKFLENPYGQKNITVAWSPEGDENGGSELAAHYAGYPVQWRLGDSTRRGFRPPRPSRTLTAMQVGDTMTRPSHRSVGRGPTSLLVRCVRHFYASRCEERVAFNFGFNTGNIRKFSLRFVRAEEVEPVPFWTRNAVPPPSPRRSYAVAHFSLPDLDQQSRAFDRFFERAAPAYGTLVLRNSAWLRWRYLTCPDPSPFVLIAAFRWRKVVGWSVFRRRAERLVWCDALYLPGHADASRTVLASALEHDSLAGDEHPAIEGIEGWFTPRPDWWRAELEAQGFERAPEPNDLALLCVSHQRRDAAALLGGAYYTLGDGDLA